MNKITILPSRFLDRIKSLNLQDVASIVGVVLSISTIHFAAFINNFDIAMLAIVDASAVAGYFLIMSLYIVSSVVGARLLIFFNLTILNYLAERLIY